MTYMNWSAMTPELLLLAMALVVSMVDLWVKDPGRRPTYWLTQLTLLAVAALHLWKFHKATAWWRCRAWWALIRSATCWPLCRPSSLPACW